jgi:hypothetical protein
MKNKYKIAAIIISVLMIIGLILPYVGRLFG